MRFRLLRVLFVLCISILVLSESLIAQEVPEPEVEPEKERSFLMFGPEDKPKQFLPMPLLVQNPTLGTGGGLALTFMFKTNYEDEDTPYSAVSLPGFYTNSKSYFFGSFASLHFMGGKLRTTVGGGYGRVNNNYDYGDAGSIDQEIGFSMGVLRASYAVIPHLYLGGAYSISYVDYLKFEVNGIPALPDNVFSSGLFLTAEWDNKNNIYNPTAGFLASFKPGFFPTWLGSDSTYISLDYNFNGYQKIVDPLLLAYRVAGSHAFLDASYSALPTLGKGPDLRGYKAGQYRGSNLISTQAEFRWNFVWQLYLTAFGGIGTFYGSETPSTGLTSWDGVAFPSAGFGLTLLTAEETGIVIRTDFAWSKDGEFAWYFQMGNSF